MTQIFVFTAGNAEARRHLTDSITSPITVDVTTYAASDEERALFTRVQTVVGAFYAWGAEPGERNIPNWEAMREGDVVLCVFDATYRFLARVVGKTKNARLAKAIWGQNEETNRTWEYMYFLTRPEAVNVPLDQLGTWLNDRYMGFFKIAPGKIARIEGEFGGVAAFVLEKFHLSGSTLPEHFLDVMRTYRDAGAVFLSAAQHQRYRVLSVSDSAAEIARIDAAEPARVTGTLYEIRVEAVRRAGGTITEADLDATKAISAALRQGRHLGLGPDGRSVLALETLDAGAANLAALVQNLRVDKSGGDERPYKPLVLACLLDGIQDGSLRSNAITFDWLAPRFLEKAQSRGMAGVGEQQAAYAFFHLASELFWVLCYRAPSRPIEAGGASAAALRDQVRHAMLKEPYWTVLQDAARRQAVRQALETRWFPTGRVDMPEAWIFQGNPTLFDLKGALGELTELTSM